MPAAQTLEPNKLEDVYPKRGSEWLDVKGYSEIIFLDALRTSIEFFQ